MTTIKELMNGSQSEVDAFLMKLPENLDTDSAVYYLNKQYQSESTGVDNRYEFDTLTDSYDYDDNEDDYNDYNGYDYDDEDEEW